MNKATRYEYIVYISLFALIAVFFRQHTLLSMASNQVSQMPLVMRSLDPGFLLNDWYVNEMSGLNGRTFFIALVAGAARVFGFEAAYFGLYLAGTLFSAGVIYYATVRVFRAGETAGLIAAMLVMSWELIDFGAVLQVANLNLIPAHLTKSMSLLALCFAMQRRGLACGLLAGLTSLLQPLLGVACGIMALGALFTVALIKIDADWRPRLQIDRPLLTSAALGSLCLLPFAVFWANLSATALDLETYVYTVATIRNPHHYLPSTWGPTRYLQMGLFLLATGLLFIAWRRSLFSGSGSRNPTGNNSLAVSLSGSSHVPSAVSSASPPAKNRDNAFLQSYLLVFAAGLTLLCILGYVFVEVWPIRAVVTLQAYRYLYIVLWFAMIFAAIAVVQVGTEGSFVKRCVFCLLLIGANGTLQPLVFTIGAGAYLQWTRHPDRRVSGGELALAAAVSFMFLESFRDYHADMSHILLSLIVAAVASFVLTIQQSRTRLTTVAASIALVVMAATWAGPRLTPLANLVSERFNLYSYPTFDALTSHADRLDVGFAGLIETATFANRQLPEDAVFLTPPNFGAFRIFAERAIVVDFKSWTFGDPAGWLERIRNVYGALDGAGGFPMMARLDERYQSIDDSQIARVAERYGARYAVLHLKTGSAYPAVFEGESYKIVEIRPDTKESE